MAGSTNGKRRVTCKRPHPNPHIHEMLMDVYREAVRKRSCILPDLEEAISSFEKYPLPVTSGSECAIIKGFNQSLCNYIDYELNRHSSENEDSDHEKSSDKPSEPGNEQMCSNLDSKTVTSTRNTRKKNKNFVKKREKRSFRSIFGESNCSNCNIAIKHCGPSSASNPKGGSVKESHLTASKSNKVNEKNNNCSVNANTLSEALHMNFENINKQTFHPNCDSPIETLQYDGFNDPSALLGKWESIPYKESAKHKIKPPKARSIDLKCTFRPIEPARNGDHYDDEEELAIQNVQYSPNSRNYLTHQKLDSKYAEIPRARCESAANYDCSRFQSIQCRQFRTKSTQTLQNNNENTSLKRKIHDCDHSEAACLQCSNITSTANAFETSFKQKMKKDMEEIAKLVLPRKLYLPGYRSPSYAILAALLEQRNECPYRISLTKEELIQKAQKHTDQSFTKPQIDCFHTAWAHAQKLVTKGMIEIVKHDKTGEELYTLTTIGRAVGMGLVKNTDSHLTVNDVIYGSLPNDRVPSLDDVVLSPPPPLVPPDDGESSDPLFIEMPSGTFEIVLLIDKREHFQPSRSHNCKFELRSLTVGDFVWVARSKKTGQELVLPYIVERKRMDDLGSSIKDGRFHEQKFRLRKSGVKNVIYLIESYGRNRQVGLPLSTLKQAMVNTCVQDDFMVVNTDSLDHTFNFLGMMSDRLVHDFLARHLRGSNRDTQGKELMTFEYFNKTSSKNKPLAVKETFIKMLLQLKGLSVEKALAITNKYQTPMALMKAYDRCTEKEGELLLAGLKCNNFSRSVGPAISKTIYQWLSII